MGTEFHDDEFEWDEAKDSLNLIKHGVSFELAKLIFDDPNVITHAPYFVKGEDRFNSLGRVTSTLILHVTHTNSADQERIRIISARKADAKECKYYETEILKKHR